MTKNIHLATSLQQCFSNQNRNCKIIYIIIGCIMGLFLLWLIALSVIKSRKGQMGQRGPPGLRGREGASGPPGPTSDKEMKNEKVFYITKNTDFSTSTEVKPQSGFILGNGVNSDVTITLPHYSVVGNGAVFHIFNQSPVFNFTIKAAKVSGQSPAQMSFTSGGTAIKLIPRQFLTIVIMEQQYAVFNQEVKNKKPILHWVDSWKNCGGIPQTYQSFPSYDGFLVGPSLQTWGCKNYRKGMDVVQINSTVRNANTLGKNPKDVPSGGIFVVENLNRSMIHSTGGIMIKSDKPVNINRQGRIGNRRSSSVLVNKEGRVGNRRTSSVILNTQGRVGNRRTRSVNLKPKRRQMSAMRSRKRRRRSRFSAARRKRMKEEKERKKKAQEELKRKQMMQGNQKSKKSSSVEPNNKAITNLANAITFSRLMRRR